MAEILTIVVTYNGMKWIDKCLRSVLGSAVPSDVLVVDNASEDETAAWVKGHYPEVKLIENKENLGFAEANNTGLRHALQQGYRYVYLLNQDAWVFPETFGTLLRVFGERETGADEGQAGRDSRKKPCRTGILSPMQMEANLMEMDAQFRKHCAPALRKDDGEVVKVPFVMAAHWMLSRECLEAVGGFSPEFPHYGEDLDYIHRAEYHGFGAAVVKTAAAVHDRAGRPRPKDYRMRLKVVTARTAVADPRRNPHLALLGQCALLALQGALHLSTIPWKGIRELRASFGGLQRSRAAARARGAFLQ